MTDLRDTNTYRARRFAGIVALIAVGIAGAMIAGSWWLWEREKKLAATSKRDLSNSTARLETIKRERDDLLGSEATYRMLSARGVFAPEQRVDFIETMKALRNRHHLVSLEYELLPQRALKFATGVSYGAAEIRASRLSFKAKALTDADLIGFLDEFPRIVRGFFPMDQCVLKRTDLNESSTSAGTAYSGSAKSTQSPSGSLQSEGQAPVVGGSIEADCLAEWITLVEKSPDGTPAKINAVAPK